MVTEQIPLRFAWRDGLCFENYYAAGNAEAAYHLQRAAAGEGEQFLFLWGADGVGKSHLLQAACQHAAERHRTVAYLPMVEMAELSPEIFDGLEQMSVVCIDDLQRVAGNAQWDEALFHFYNRVRDAGGELIAAANAAPAALDTRLHDLRSRLCWGPVLQLTELDDAGKVAALQLRARGRGFDLPDDVARFLMRRSARDMGSLFALLDRLDEASLVQQRKLTIPFVRGLV